jgi:hypothetical protein
VPLRRADHLGERCRLGHTRGVLMLRRCNE